MVGCDVSRFRQQAVRSFPSRRRRHSVPASTHLSNRVLRNASAENVPDGVEAEGLFDFCIGRQEDMSEGDADEESFAEEVGIAEEAWTAGCLR